MKFGVKLMLMAGILFISVAAFLFILDAFVIQIYDIKEPIIWIPCIFIGIGALLTIISQCFQHSTNIN